MQAEHLKENWDKKLHKPNTVINMAVSTDNDARIFAKTAFNLVAKIKGSEYANKTEFNKFKKWIMGEENSKFTQLPGDLKLFQFPNINDKIHYCALMNIDGFFVAIVTFYNHWTMGFNICPAFDIFLILHMFIFVIGKIIVNIAC